MLKFLHSQKLSKSFILILIDALMSHYFDSNSLAILLSLRVFCQDLMLSILLNFMCRVILQVLKQKKSNLSKFQAMLIEKNDEVELNTIRLYSKRTCSCLDSMGVCFQTMYLLDGCFSRTLTAEYAQWPCLAFQKTL